MNFHWLSVCLCGVAAAILAVGIGCNGESDSGPTNRTAKTQQPLPVQVRTATDGNWELLRNGQPYYIRGAAGTGSLELLASSGGNSIRTWGVDNETLSLLDRAHANGISVTVGIWLEHERKGFDYGNASLLEQQTKKVLEAVKQYKDHPAVLIWGIGNEMEGYESGDNPQIWAHVEQLAQLIKQEDPHHPTMTVIAEIGGQRVPAIHQHCPSLDIIGINAYGGASSLPQRYRDAGGRKPFIVTEYGPPGTWEVPKNSIGAIVEPTSTAKAQFYRQTYSSLKQEAQLCLGSYAFLWGDKMEATPTWFGMLLPDGNKTAAVDTMTELWSGKPPANLCPRIESFELEGPDAVDYGATVKAKLQATDPEGQELETRWVLSADAKNYITAGDFQKTPPTYMRAIEQFDDQQAIVRMPNKRGLYRLYVYVTDTDGGAASANLPIRVKDPAIEQPGETVELPYTLYAEPGETGLYVPSGFMGSTDALAVDQQCTEQPYAGEYCIQCSYSKAADWGGVVWQHPENDWGELPGGLNLTGATKMTFWARGKRGGEKIKFGVGLLGDDKPFFDTTKHELPFTLSTQWTQYSIDLSKSDLRRIKSGFFFSLAGQGEPLTFYLDNIIFE